MWSAALLPIAFITFATWAVYLGGLAALQSGCDSSTGFGSYGLVNDVLPCMKAYRLYWFYMAWEAVILTMMVCAIVTGTMHKMRPAFVGLFAIATVLFIEASNTFLNGQSNQYYQSGQNLHRIRTITAGAIMTALMNAIAVIAIGTAHEEDRDPVGKHNPIGHPAVQNNNGMNQGMNPGMNPV